MVVRQATSTPVPFSGASGCTITWPGIASGQMLITVFVFEGVAAGSGPWVQDDDGSGGSHHRVFYQAPEGGSGVGLEVWAANIWDSGTITNFNFAGSETGVAQGIVYTGQLTGTVETVIRAALSRAWTGDDPETPSFYAFEGETLIAVAGEQLQSPGFGTPTPGGWSEAVDSSRAGYGTAELTAADKVNGVEGASGAIPWAAIAASVGDKGATGIFAIRPDGTVVAASSPLIAVEYAVAD